MPHFFFSDIPKVWALPDLIRDIFDTIVNFLKVYLIFKTFFKVIFTFIGAFFLIGGFFKTLKAFFEIFNLKHPYCSYLYK